MNDNIKIAKELMNIAKQLKANTFPEYKFSCSDSALFNFKMECELSNMVLTTTVNGFIKTINHIKTSFDNAFQKFLTDLKKSYPYAEIYFDEPRLMFENNNMIIFYKGHLHGEPSFEILKDICNRNGITMI